MKGPAKATQLVSDRPRAESLPGVLGNREESFHSWASSASARRQLGYLCWDRNMAAPGQSRATEAQERKELSEEEEMRLRQESELHHSTTHFCLGLHTGGYS